MMSNEQVESTEIYFHTYKESKKVNRCYLCTTWIYNALMKTYMLS